ncbi:MAG: DNRLRE domain-containing protein [Candidatus Omnitrophota bacterium]|nr:DNRLRE domain-containing protein [Candidatus Omnitrophota bacterium]MDZ4241389.1 DNRLRE domain-containing protein [Candidatus Omnitrophota bacterium]
MARGRFILALLLLGCLGLVLDNHFSRLSRLEWGTRDLPALERRTAALEAHLSRLDSAEARLSRLDAEAGLIRDHEAALKVLAYDRGLFRMLMTREVLQKEGIEVLLTGRGADEVSDVRIGSDPSHQRVNWGATPAIGTGGGDNNNRYRSLIKFSDVRSGRLQGGTILAAAMYLYQYDNAAEDDLAAKSTLNLYSVLRPWNEGGGIGYAPRPQESSWMAASDGEREWKEPGCSGAEDCGQEVLASTGPHVYGNADGWVVLPFTDAGTAFLQACFDGAASCDGFLLKSEEESLPNTFTAFRSSEFSGPSHSPFLEIFYRVPRPSGLP